jgi:hypothetical protein
LTRRAAACINTGLSTSAVSGSDEAWFTGGAALGAIKPSATLLIRTSTSGEPRLPIALRHTLSLAGRRFRVAQSVVGRLRLLLLILRLLVLLVLLWILVLILVLVLVLVLVLLVLVLLLLVNRPEFHAPSGFCEPAGWLASN